MLSVYVQGIMLGLALIVPLGPQNVFILNQGIKRNSHLISASICTLSDILLIMLGVFGGSALLSRSPFLLALVSWGGVVFLMWFGWGALRRALHAGQADNQVTHTGRQPVWQVILSLLMVTWLNPHVYLDTFVVLGGIGGQLPAMSRPWFAAGTITASVIWFFGLALMAEKLALWLSSGKAQRIINFLVAGIMWWLALKLVITSLAMQGVSF